MACPPCNADGGETHHDEQRQEDAPPADISTRPGKLAWAIAAALGIAVLGLALLYFSQRPPEPPEVSRFQIRLPEKVARRAG